MGQTFFKRLSWSPDGSQICAVHAVDQSQLISTASIVNREKWEEEACLIGHHGVIECSVRVSCFLSTCVSFMCRRIHRYCIARMKTANRFVFVR